MNAATLFQTGLEETTLAQIALSLLLAFVLGQAVAWCYAKTYEGLSYSRGFAQSLVLGPLVAALLMLAIGDNLARGLGILGTMALVRFRTNVREARDMIFVFAALGIGVACGARAIAVGLIGTAAFMGAAFTLSVSPFARRLRFEGVLRFWVTKTQSDPVSLEKILKTHCRSHTLVAVRDVGQGEGLEYAWQVRLRSPAAREQLVEQLGAIEGLSGLSLLLPDAHAEL